MDRTETRRGNLYFRRYCQTRLTKSHLPPGIARTLALILENIGSKTDYTYCYKSQREIAAVLHPHSRSGHKTIETHVRILKEVGLITVQALTLADAEKTLAGYGNKLNLHFKDRLNFYSINPKCPFWSDDKQGLKVVDAVAARLKTRYARAGGNARGRTPETPVDAHPETPVDARGETPVGARAKHVPGKKDAVDTPSFSGKHTTGSEHTPEPARPSSLTQTSQKGVASTPTVEEPSSWAGDGGFDYNEEHDSPRLSAVEGVAGSHPLHGPVGPDSSPLTSEPERCNPRPDSVSASDEETVLDEPPPAASGGAVLGPEPAPAVPTPVRVPDSTDAEEDGFLAGDGSIDFLFSHLEVDE